MNNNIPVSILLSTHNGAEYLPDLLNSLFQQTHKNWQLFLRDDCSQDDTPKIITHFLHQDPQKINLLSEPQTSHPLGAAQSFNRLLKKSTGQYFMFADQDDVWHHDKIELSLKKLIHCEKLHGTNTPILIHTDLAVVDESLNTIDGSYIKYRNIDPTRSQTCQLLIQNIVTGCTTCFNKALRDLANDIPISAPMHDWWLALVASCFGVIEFIDQPTIDYRQHSQNIIGAHTPDKIMPAAKIVAKLKKMRAELDQSIKQAQSMLDHYNQQLTPKQKKLLHTFATIKKNSALKKRLLLSKHNIYFDTIGRNVGLLLTI